MASALGKELELEVDTHYTNDSSVQPSAFSLPMDNGTEIYTTSKKDLGLSDAHHTNYKP